jgi:DNA-binding transcriptional MocR family regulator
LTLFYEPQGGLFVWARLPEGLDAAALAQRAVEEGIMLAPGNVFSPHLKPSPWLRFNVASCNDPRVYRFLERAAEISAKGVDAMSAVHPGSQAL